MTNDILTITLHIMMIAQELLPWDRRQYCIFAGGEDFKT